LANLNFEFAKRFFEFLTREGYIAEGSTANGKTNPYQLTQKGEHLLELLHQVEAELEPLFSQKRT
jgi:predicted transcriptional regulator